MSRLSGHRISGVTRMTGGDANWLDCSAEVSELRDIPSRAANWLSRDIQLDDWRVLLTDKARDELLRVANYVLAQPVGLMQRSIQDLDVPACADLMQQVKHKVDNGVGFAVLDRLPTERLGVDVLNEIFWLLGQFIGRPVAQKFRGDMLYHVHDSGQAFQYGVRGSYTNIELNFHTDNAFGRRVPDVVALFCHRAAMQGGVSRFCSLYAVHERIAAASPEALQRLYQPMLFDRQMEHAANEAPVTLAPFFSWRGDRLFARANPSLVRKGYQVAGQEPDEALVTALRVVDDVSATSDLWYEAALEPGQLQYLNNHEVGHYRSQFTDADNPEQKRSLYRLWYRQEGSTSYHGDPLQ